MAARVRHPSDNKAKNGPSPDGKTSELMGRRNDDSASAGH